MNIEFFSICKTFVVIEFIIWSLVKEDATSIGVYIYILVCTYIYTYKYINIIRGFYLILCKHYVYPGHDDVHVAFHEITKKCWFCFFFWESLRGISYLNKFTQVHTHTHRYIYTYIYTFTWQKYGENLYKLHSRKSYYILNSIKLNFYHGKGHFLLLLLL